MPSKERIRYPRYLVRYPSTDASIEPAAVDPEVPADTECITLSPAARIPPLEPSDICGTGLSLRKRAAERRSRETLFTVLLFLAGTGFVLFGCR
jgi:hypothetical protein